MTDPGKDESHENLFQIIDGIIAQLNNTRRMFILMILSAMIITPLSFALTFAFFGPPYEERWWHGPRAGFGPEFGTGPAFGIARLIPIILVVVWLGVGIRQWYILSKWTTKYETYKELQRKIDEKLDFEKDEGEKKS